MDRNWKHWELVGLEPRCSQLSQSTRACFPRLLDQLASAEAHPYSVSRMRPIFWGKSKYQEVRGVAPPHRVLSVWGSWCICVPHCCCATVAGSIGIELCRRACRLPGGRSISDHQDRREIHTRTGYHPRKKRDSRDKQNRTAPPKCSRPDLNR